MSALDQILSDSCSWCPLGGSVTTTPVAASGDSNCCPSGTSFFTALLSNTCNLCDPVGNALGIAGVPEWIWIVGFGALAFYAVEKWK
jgi:hypothetical protein